MKAKDLINYMIPPLKKEDEITRAKQWMDEFRVKELPVIDSGKLIGFISEEMLYDSEIMYAEVGAYPLVSSTCRVVAWTHYYDILKILKEHKMGMIAVVEEDFFLGVVVIEDILNEFAQTAIVNTEGAIVTLKSTLNNYSLNEISKIVEINESMIVGVNLKPNIEDPSLVDIELRINSLDVNQISNMLSKNGYTVTSSFNTEDKSFDEKERLDLLMKFIEP